VCCEAVYGWYHLPEATPAMVTLAGVAKALSA
jgi:hypothetical protein